MVWIQVVSRACSSWRAAVEGGTRPVSTSPVSPGSRACTAGFSAAQADTIKIGAPIPQTGPFASDGSVMEKAIKLAADDLNSDIHASAEYRAHLVNVMAQRAVAAARLVGPPLPSGNAPSAGAPLRLPSKSLPQVVSVVSVMVPSVVVEGPDEAGSPERKSSRAAEAQQQASDSQDKKPAKSRWSLAISGSVSVNAVHDAAEALVARAALASGTGGIDVTATDVTDIYAVSGAVTAALNTTNAKGVAGAVVVHGVDAWGVVLVELGAVVQQVRAVLGAA